MKIIHTYVPVFKDGIDKYTVYQMTLSLLLAKRHYNNVVLYTNDEIGKLIKKIGLPYDEINTEVLKDCKERTFSIPKLLVYKAQTEPYIHIDLDTFIFDRIDFDDKECIYSCFPEGSGDLTTFDKSNAMFHSTYLTPVYEIKDKLPDEFTKNIIFKDIPNMSVFGGFQYDLISEATKYCLDLYYKNKHFFNSNYYNACVIEQLFIYSAIKMLSKTIKFKYLFEGNPSHIDFLEEKFKMPFKFKSRANNLWIFNKEDLFKNTMYNFDGFLHLNGYKNFDEMNFILKQRIIEDFGKYNILINIDNNILDETIKCDIYCKEYNNYLKKLVDNLDKIIDRKKILM
jgi:hypothetical protein